MPLFSVIIPNYNRAKYLKDALDSVFQQTFTDYEVIVIDDGSTDTTKEVVSAYYNKSGLIHYFYQTNQGRSAARNAGIKASKGEILAFLDSDDQWFPTKLEKQKNYLEMHKDVQMLHGHVSIIGEDGRENPDMTRKIQKLWKMNYKNGQTYENWCLQCCCFLSTVAIRAEVLQEIGSFDQEFQANEDLDFYLRLTYKHKVGFINEGPLVKYRVHSNNSANDLLARNAIKVANKHLKFLASPSLLKINRHLAERNLKLLIAKSHFVLGEKRQGRKYFFSALFSMPSAVFSFSVTRLFLVSWLPKTVKKYWHFLNQYIKKASLSLRKG